MQQIAINENELAARWGVSPKTLQRWRSEACSISHAQQNGSVSLVPRGDARA